MRNGWVTGIRDGSQEEGLVTGIRDGEEGMGDGNQGGGIREGSQEAR